MNQLFDFNMDTGFSKGANLSPCRAYRYLLWRTWNEPSGHVAFIGLNPSTANESLDDPTIRRCIGFARKWGYGGVWMLNLFAFRATDPKEMKAAADPIGLGNNDYLNIQTRRARLVVACWGAHGFHLRRGEKVIAMLDGPIYCLGMTKHGHPRHPLYLSGSTTPKRFVNAQ